MSKGSCDHPFYIRSSYKNNSLSITLFMLLTISTTYQPATDLGYLLHKNPHNMHETNLSFGKALVFYPTASQDYCEAALLVDIDTVELIRNRKYFTSEGFSLYEYVNDRPYVASSFACVALSSVFRSAMSGKCKDKPELVNQQMPLQVKISVLPCRGGEKLLRRLFEPLGYEIHAEEIVLHETKPEWGNSSYMTVTLKNDCTVKELLNHLYVLLPVLDNDKHYWIGHDEIQKLLKHGEGWIKEHPEIELITSRYLKSQRYLVDEALSQLQEEDAVDFEVQSNNQDHEEALLEKKVNLHTIRLSEIVKELENLGVHKVIDLGCGEGKLIKLLLKKSSFDKVAGMDISMVSLQRAKQNLNVDTLPEGIRNRLTLFLGSLIYRDRRFSGYDAAILSEVIEHLEPFQLDYFEEVIFAYAKPKYVIITTPNVEYNVLFKDLPAGKFRHQDHRFEWTRQELREWADKICTRYNYQVDFKPLGPVHEVFGAPSQMVIFRA